MNMENMDKLLEKYVSEGVPGCSVIVYKDHKEIYRGKCGYADIESKTPISYDNLFYIYSATKVVTCTAVMILVGMGKIEIDDPLAKYIPEFKDMKVWNYHSNGTLLGTRPAAREITIRDLMAMSSGLDYDVNSAQIKRVFEETDGRCPTVKTMKAIAEKPLCFDPGEHYKYSLSHDVLGALIEVVSGMSFGEFLKKHIFDVLGMESTTFRLNDSNKSRMATLYKHEDGKSVPVNKNIYVLGSEYESGGAGLISCLEDYGKFVDALACGGVGANGARILSSELLELMRQDQFTDQRAIDFFDKKVGYGYGLGVRVHIDKAKSLRPTPLGEFGWGGAAGAFAAVDPVNDITVYYSQHVRKSPFGPIRKDFIEAAKLDLGFEAFVEDMYNGEGNALA